MGETRNKRVDYRACTHCQGSGQVQLEPWLQDALDLIRISARTSLVERENTELRQEVEDAKRLLIAAVQDAGGLIAISVRTQEIVGNGWILNRWTDEDGATVLHAITREKER